MLIKDCKFQPCLEKQGRASFSSSCAAQLPPIRCRCSPRLTNYKALNPSRSLRPLSCCGIEEVVSELVQSAISATNMSMSPIMGITCVTALEDITIKKVCDCAALGEHIRKPRQSDFIERQLKTPRNRIKSCLFQSN